MFVTTTNSIENHPVEKYLGLVSTNLVVGTNVFSDFVASMSDFFGGMSGTYRKQLETLYSKAIEDIISKARTKGANAVLGLHMDFDEISGKGKSMFMVSLYGTAVVVAHNDFEQEDSVIESVSLDMLELEYFKNKWKERDPKEFVDEDDWDFILSHNIPEIADSLFDFYAFVCSNEYLGSKELTQRNFKTYFSQLPRDVAEECAYGHLETSYALSMDLIKSNNLFSPKRALSLIESNAIRCACELLTVDKSEYTREDVQFMRKFANVFDELPDIGSIEQTEGGRFSGPRTIYVCPRGHINKDARDYCNHFDGGYICGLNIKGLTQEDERNLIRFKERLTVLESILR